MAFNLFDFSQVINPLGNIKQIPGAPQIQGATGGGMMPPTTSAQPLPNRTIPKKPSFMDSFVPKVSASGEYNDVDLANLKMFREMGISDDEAISVVDEKKAIREAPAVEPTIATPIEGEQPGFLEKTFKGLTSAPEAAFEGLSGLMTSGVKSLIGREKFKKPGEIGNLGEVVQEEKAPLTNVLKTTKGLTGTAFTTAVPGISTALAGIGATDTGGKVLKGIGDVIHYVGQSALNQIPTLKEMTIEEKNDFTDTLVNTFGVRSATKGVGGKAGIIKKLDTHPGVTLKELGSGLINMFYETERGTAKAMQNYTAGLSPTKPITIGDVAGKYNIAGGTKQMGADAIVAKSKLWQSEIAPLVEKTRNVTTGDTLMSTVLGDIGKIVEPTQKSAMTKAFNQISQQYKGKQFSAKELADLKSTLQAKTLNVSETSAARGQILDLISKAGRKTLIENVKKETGVDITNKMFEYGALRTLEEMGQKAAEGAENIRLTGRASSAGATLGIIDALSSVITPIKNIAGGIIYKLGNGLEFIGPKGIITITDILKNSENINIRNPQVLMNILQEQSLKTGGWKPSTVPGMRPDVGLGETALQRSQPQLAPPQSFPALPPASGKPITGTIYGQPPKPPPKIVRPSGEPLTRSPQSFPALPPPSGKKLSNIIYGQPPKPPPKIVRPSGEPLTRSPVVQLQEMVKNLGLSVEKAKRLKAAIDAIAEVYNK